MNWPKHAKIALLKTSPYYAEERQATWLAALSPKQLNLNVKAICDHFKISPPESHDDGKNSAKFVDKAKRQKFLLKNDY